MKEVKYCSRCMSLESADNGSCMYCNSIMKPIVVNVQSGDSK